MTGTSTLHSCWQAGAFTAEGLGIQANHPEAGRPPVTSAYRQTSDMATIHSATLETWIAQVGSDSALAGSSRRRTAASTGAAWASTAAATTTAAPLASWPHCCALERASG